MSEAYGWDEWIAQNFGPYWYMSRNDHPTNGRVYGRSVYVRMRKGGHFEPTVVYYHNEREQDVLAGPFDTLDAAKAAYLLLRSA